MEFLKQYKILLKKSKSDLKAGKNLLEDFENKDKDLDICTIMFHFQQSAEELLKALLAYNKIHFTKTHDIEELINILNKNNIKISNGIEKLTNLTEFAVDGRYAVVHDDIDDAGKYIDILKQLTTCIEKMIKKEEN